MGITFEGLKRSVSDNQQCIDVTILSDTIVEYEENFFLHLSTNDGQVMLYPDETEVVIVDNDSECNFITCIYIHPPWATLQSYIRDSLSVKNYMCF